MKKSLLLCLAGALSFNCISQQISDPETLFKQGNYKDALSLFLTNYDEQHPTPETDYKIGYCYLHTNSDKTKAVLYLVNATKSPKCDAKAWYWLGKAYHLDNKFDEAILAYKKYLPKSKGEEKKDVKRQIEMCENGKKLIKNPINVSFENLGKEINSEYADYNPFIPAKESFLVYSSNRKPAGINKQQNGNYPSDIYFSEVQKGKFTQAKVAGNGVNTGENEECVGLSNDGKSCLIYVDRSNVKGDVGLSEINNDSFSGVKFFNASVNSANLESSANINTDNTILVFASNRPGGFGGTDIYISKLLPDGTWSEAKNMGPAINTPYNEDFPQLSEDGNTLFFSSQGHESMGGYDIFKSTLDAYEGKWTTPQNLGYPLNTSDDEVQFAINETGREAYISAVRKEGFGDLDLYKVTFNSVDPKLTFVKGRMFYADNMNPVTENMRVNVIDKSTGLAVNQHFKYSAKKQKFFLALPPGEYILEVEAPGYKKTNSEMMVYDKCDYKKEDVAVIVLEKKEKN